MPALTSSTAPPPAALGHLRASNQIGWRFFALAVVLSVTGTALASGEHLGWWAVGQGLLALAFVEWFVLLHECGHATLFASRRLNLVVGHIAGVFALIPFPVWTRIHGRHHKWTGWQDMDPTTAPLAPKARPMLERRVVNVCWKYWIPLFSVLYRAGNFWNLPRLVRLFPAREVHRRLVGSALVLAGLYAALFLIVGPLALIRVCGLAVLVAFVVEDVLLISQHTHIPMGQANGHDVPPVRAIDQEVFTRSMRLPPALSRLALRFDAHELHHMYPFVPGYRLGEIPYTPHNEVSWWRWVPAARAIPGEVLLFQNRHESGIDI